MPAAASVAFLWHFHQPDYRDPAEGRPILPWVRLHASRAYFDLAWLHARHPGLRSTVNFVPVLVEQLQAFIAGERDRYWQLARKPARDLTAAERAFIVERFFAIHPDHGIRRRPRYHALQKLRDQGPEAFSVADLRDLQALFNLAWFGFAARVEYPFLAEMEQKGRDFREDEKRKILDLQVHTARRILPLWRTLMERGQVELTTTPYAHPILPLLIDSDVMARCQPNAPRPPRFSFPADAAAQIQRAAEAHRAWTGVAPVGLWPAEGAISQAAAEQLVAEGIGHLATDEAQLFRSLPPETPRGALYQPWRLPVGEAHLDLVFRDRNLSDLIGFTYARNDARVAVDDLLDRIRAAGAEATHPHPLVTIALDGENPWDAYPESGRAFLETLATRLEAASDLTPVRLIDHLAAHPPTATLAEVAPGSWINGDFGIWIGGSVENTAWRLLGDARRAVDAVGPTRPAADVARAREHLLIAEGSDWFWWFGEPFHGENDADFDHLFRARLRAAWVALGLTPPDAVEQPLDPPAPVAPVAEPRQLLRPRFAPADSTWFEWAGAGIYALGHGVAAMYQATQWFVRLLYGFDLQHAFFRFEPAEGASTAGMTLRLRLHAGADLHVVDVPLDGEVRASLARLDPDLTTRETLTLPLVKRRRGVVELGVPFAELGLVAGDVLQASAFLMQDRVCLARYPAAGDVRVTVPDAQFEARHWTA
ncbi:MAG: glycoside hydrolase family 57 protein [bacterium]